MEIKILGSGCSKCQSTEKNVKEALAESGLDVQVDKVTEVMEIAKYGVFITPAVIIDGKVKSVGKIPDTEEIKIWIKQ
jgi:small redox-active disulfide protein 2